MGETKECWIPGKENHTGKSSQNRKAVVVKVHEGRGAWPERQSGGTLGATLKIPSLF